LILETAAAERAALNASPEQVVLLKEMSVISYNIDDPQSHIQFLKTNRGFHLALAEAAGNRRLVVMLEGLLIELDRLFHLGLRLRDSSEEMRREHQEVVAALETGDVEGVRAAITRQILTSRDRVMEAIMRGQIRPVQVTG
jgi:DNA-binding GntR family transcriptional regulator